MAYNEILADRIRQALVDLSGVEEKKMFGGIAFLVNGKMCITAGTGRMMCRIDPKKHEGAISRKGCSTVIMKGREYKGYVYISENNIQTRANLDYWIRLALDFNKNAKVSDKR